MPSKRKERSTPEVFELAEAVSHLFHDSMVEKVKAQLAQLAKTEREVARNQGRLEWIRYVVRLILSCPQLTSGPPGFEWVERDWQEILMDRRMAPEVDLEFWVAITQLRGTLRPGRPSDLALDLFRTACVRDLMTQMAGLEKLTQTFRKTRAIEQLAEMEKNLFGYEPDIQAIRRSLKRAAQLYQKMINQISKYSPPDVPSETFSGSRKKSPRKSKK